jgi:hypothetical protein
MKSKPTELGYFGNIWIRQHYYEKAGDHHDGHRHNFDHITMLAKGSVKCEVEGYEPKVFTAPTFLTIKKELYHKFTALEDDTFYYCIFALRDLDGNVTDVYTGDNSPYGAFEWTEENRKQYERLVDTTKIMCPGCDCFEEKTVGITSLVKM